MPSARPNPQLAVTDAARPRDDVGDRVGDVDRFELLDLREALGGLLADLRANVIGELRRDNPGLDRGDPHMATGHFLAQ